MTNFFNIQTNFRNIRTIQDNQNSIINSRNLYQDVVRKNQEIIKQILSKINDLYSRQQDFDSSLKLINQKLIKINQQNDQLHHQFRANHIEIQRKHQDLLNDLHEVQGVLKAPEPQQNHQKYLQRDFFKQQSALVNLRTRKGRKGRHQTNIFNSNFYNQDKNQKKNSNLLNYQGKSKPFSQAKIGQKKQTETQDYFKQKSKAQISNFAEIQTKIYKQSDKNYEFLINQKVEAIKQKLQASLNSSKEEIKIKSIELTQTIKKLQSQFQAKMEKMNRKQQDWGQINFDQLHNYRQNKIREELHQKISKKYFQESLNNLKQSWQQELDQAYLIINSKLNQKDLLSIEQKLNQLNSQIQSLNNLNSIKIQNFSYNSTCKSTPQRFSPHQRIISREMIVSANNTRQFEDIKIYKKNELDLSNSCSSIFKIKRSNEQKKSVNNEDQNMLKWKGKVMQTLGLVNKKVRRVKRSD